MSNLWRVAVFEYRRNVFKKSFLLMLLSVPLLIAFMIGLGLFIESNRDDARPVGVVDQAGVITKTVLSPELRARWLAEYKDPIEFIAYATEEEALAALETGDIQAFYLLQADYVSTRRVEQKYIEQPGGNAGRQFFDFLQVNLAAQQPPEVAVRVAAGTKIIVRSVDGRRSNPEGGPTFGLMMPFFITIAFLVLLLMSSNYALAALVDEKENRTMEVLFTSVSPFHLVGGKVLGVVAISMTLLVTWGLVVLTGILVAARLGTAWLSDLTLDWRIVLATLAIGLPAYVLAIALMIAIGSVVAAEQESQSIGAIFVFLHLAPFYATLTFFNNPHNLLAIILSLLPFTAMTTIGARNLFTIVPAWQVLVSMAIQGLCALGALWLASRAFRQGMLRYGQRLGWRKFFKTKG